MMVTDGCHDRVGSGDSGGPGPSSGKRLGRRRCFVTADLRGATSDLAYPHTAVPRSARRSRYSYTPTDMSCSLALLIQLANSCRPWAVREATTPALLANVGVALERTRLHCRSESSLSHAKPQAPAGLDRLPALESVVPVPSKLPRDLQHAGAGRDGDPVVPRPDSFPPVICAVDITS